MESCSIYFYGNKAPQNLVPHNINYFIMLMDSVV